MDQSKNMHEAPVDMDNGQETMELGERVVWREAKGDKVG